MNEQNNNNQSIFLDLSVLNLFHQILLDLKKLLDINPYFTTNEFMNLKKSPTKSKDKTEINVLERFVA